MISSCGHFIVVAAVAFTITSSSSLGNETSHELQSEEIPADVESVAYNGNIGDRDVAESSAERRQREVEGDATQPAAAGVPADTRSGRSRRRERDWPPLDWSAYASAVDELLDYHAQVQRAEPRVLEMPDMQREATEQLLFFEVTTRISLRAVRLSVPATLHRASLVTAEELPDGAVDIIFYVRLGDFQMWGKYDAKVAGVGPSGDFRTTIRDRILRVTIRFRELPKAANSTTAAPGDAVAEVQTTTTANLTKAAPRDGVAEVGTRAAVANSTTAAPSDTVTEVGTTAAANSTTAAPGYAVTEVGTTAAANSTTAAPSDAVTEVGTTAAANSTTAAPSDAVTDVGTTAAANSTTAAPDDAEEEVETTVAAPLPTRCVLEATHLWLADPGHNDLPASMARWAEDLEDVPTSLRIMKQLLNERLAQYPCTDNFVEMMRVGYGAYK